MQIYFGETKMIRRIAILSTLLAAMTLGFASTSAIAASADTGKSACEQKADKKKIMNEAKRAAYIKKCEEKAKKK